MQQLAYDGMREQNSLDGQHTILVCHQAAENIRFWIACRQNGKKAGKLTYTNPTVTYGRRAMTVFRKNRHVSLTTHGGHARVRTGLGLPDNEGGYQHQYLDAAEWELTESTLHYRGGEWYVHLGFRKPKQAADKATESEPVLGVDPRRHRDRRRQYSTLFRLAN